MQKIYGARFEPLYQELKELNSEEVVSLDRLTIYNDGFIKNTDDKFSGKKNYRFVVGSTQPPENYLGDSIYIFQPFVGNKSFTREVRIALGDNLNWSKLVPVVGARNISLVIFDASDRSLYLVRFVGETEKEVYYTSSLFIDSKCNFSSVQFENSLELEPNIVYKLNYLDRTLEEVCRLES